MSTVGADEDGAVVGFAVAAVHRHTSGGCGDGGDALVGKEVGLDFIREGVVEDLGEGVARDDARSEAVTGHND